MLAIIGLVLGLTAAIIILIDAFRNSVLDGLLTLFVPLYSLFYLFFRQQHLKGVTILLLVGSVGFYTLAYTDMLSANDPCKRLDTEAVGQLFGETFDNVRSGSTPRGGACILETAEKPPKVLYILTLSYCAGGEAEEYAQQEGPVRFRVHDVGDAAFSQGNELWVQQGNTCIAVVYDNNSTDYRATLPARKRVAQMVLANTE